MAVKGSVPAAGVIVPHLVVRDTSEAVAFYERAFGATVLYRSPSPTGNGEHLHLKIRDSLIQVSSEEPAYQRDRVEGALLASPESLNGSTCVFQIGVTDVDAAYKRAVDEGGSPAMPPTNMFWGADTAGSAIPLATSGHSVKFRKCLPRKRFSNECWVSQQT